jgi:hypothetical protein
LRSVPYPQLFSHGRNSRRIFGINMSKIF